MARPLLVAIAFCGTLAGAPIVARGQPWRQPYEMQHAGSGMRRPDVGDPEDDRLGRHRVRQLDRVQRRLQGDEGRSREPGGESRDCSRVTSSTP